MNKQDKILVTGAAGMVGSAIVRRLLEQGYDNITGVFHTHVPEKLAGGAVPEL